MKVILIQDHAQLGSEGEVVTLAPGYARNYLFPRGIALPATEHQIRKFRLAQEKKKRELEKQARASQEMARRLSAASCTITVAAGEEDKLFGSVTAADISEALAKEGFPVDRKQIELDEPIKKLGIYSVAVKVTPEITAQVKVWVVK